MSLTEIAPEQILSLPTQRNRQRECPPTVSRSFFDDREWAWSSGSCAAVEHSFEVLVESPLDLAHLFEPVTDSLLGDSCTGSQVRYRIVLRDNPQVQYALYVDNSRALLATTPESLLHYLTWHINRQMIEKTSVEHVVLHSAAATRAGVTVLLPGDQEHGKTTTVAGLLREGYGYVTDEAVAISPSTLHITPFPKALSIDPGAWPLFPECRPGSALSNARQWQVPATWLGSRAARYAVVPPRVIVFPKYVAGSTTRVSEITRAEGLSELAQATFDFPAQPARNLQTLGAVVRTAIVARLRIGSLDEAVLAIEEMVSESIRKEM